MAELSTIARPYAEALFATASGTDKGLDAWEALLGKLSRVAENSEVREALGDPRLSNEQRVTLFTELAQDSLSEQADNLIRLLIENKRILLLPQIAQQFSLLRHRQEGTALAEITSAFPLSDEQLDALMAGLEKRFGLKLKPVVTVDENLIGGVRVTVGDQVLDTSVQARLASMRDTLVA
ncbi:MAG: F0F1 ATP synthase subunit delta [Castellaniella sp.]